MAQTTNVDISGLDKVALLHSLWKQHTKMAAFYKSYPELLTASVELTDIKTALDGRRGYIDYLKGKSFKTDFSTDSVDPRGYDRENGDGSLKRAVEAFRRSSASHLG